MTIYAQTYLMNLLQLNYNEKEKKMEKEKELFMNVIGRIQGKLLKKYE